MLIQTIRGLLPTQPFPSEAGRRDAAVALVLTPDRRIILMKRADRAGDPWSGHLSLPGGKIEPTDSSPLHAAIRETHEEMGLRLTDCLGALTPVPTHSALPRLLIHPYVFALDKPPRFTLNDEVVSAHSVALADLLAGHRRGSFTLNWRGQAARLPSVDVDGHRLWGLTLHIIDELLSRLDQRGRGLERPVIDAQGDSS